MAEGAELLFRSMEQIDDRPGLGSNARSLGARPDWDIPVDTLGLVRPGDGGMSVSPDSPLNLPDHRRPSEWDGTGKDPIWAIPKELLGDDLVYRPDPVDPSHGFVEPARIMTFNEYEEALHETQEFWQQIRRTEDS